MLKWKKKKKKPVLHFFCSLHFSDCVCSQIFPDWLSQQQQKKDTLTVSLSVFPSDTAKRVKHVSLSVPTRHQRRLPRGAGGPQADGPRVGRRVEASGPRECVRRRWYRRNARCRQLSACRAPPVTVSHEAVRPLGASGGCNAWTELGFRYFIDLREKFVLSFYLCSHSEGRDKRW